MENEELAVLIQQGREELLPKLWEQVSGLVAKLAWERYKATGGCGGVEVEDLTQSGFLALLEAVNRFDPAKGYAFTTTLGMCLKKAFAEAGGYRTSRRDPLDGCVSLDAPLTDAGTLMELQADPANVFEEAEHRIWLAQLREAMAQAVSKLPEDQQRTIRRRYYRDESQTAAAAAEGITPGVLRRLESEGLRNLRTADELAQFIEEQTPYYVHVGRVGFVRTQTSAVELAVLKRDRLQRALAGDFGRSEAQEDV